MEKYISIEEAKYIDGYKIYLKFNDGKENTVDFKNFINPCLTGILFWESFKLGSDSFDSIEIFYVELLFSYKRVDNVYEKLLVFFIIYDKIITEILESNVLFI